MIKANNPDDLATRIARAERGMIDEEEGEEEDEEGEE
jgi:hypothetical protein